MTRIKPFSLLSSISCSSCCYVCVCVCWIDVAVGTQGRGLRYHFFFNLFTPPTPHCLDCLLGTSRGGVTFPLPDDIDLNYIFYFSDFDRIYRLWCAFLTTLRRPEPETCSYTLHRRTGRPAVLPGTWRLTPSEGTRTRNLAITSPMR